MRFRNVATGLVWDVENPDRIEELRADSGYEVVEETKKPAEAKKK